MDENEKEISEDKDDKSVEAREDDDIIPSEDKVIFGTKALAVSDKLIDTIDAKLIDGVSSLPRLAFRQPLLDLLRGTYIRNCNILEAYMARNIFSIQSLPATRRRNVVSAFCNEVDPTVPSVLSDVTNHIESHSNSEMKPIGDSITDDIPSQEAMMNLEQDLLDLRTKLSQLKQRRTQLRLDLKQLAGAEKLLSNADSISPHSKMIKENMSKLVQGKQVLQELMDVGNDVGKSLDKKKQSRPENEDEFLRKKPKLSPEEAYERDRQGIQGGTEPVSRLHVFLKSGPQPIS